MLAPVKKVLSTSFSFPKSIDFPPSLSDLGRIKLLSSFYSLSAWTLLIATFRSLFFLFASSACLW